MAAFFVLAFGVCSCTGQRPADTAQARSAAYIQARLIAGPWRLSTYRPDVRLEPMLAALLALQIRTMVVRFDGAFLSARSPTLNVVRPYTVTDVAGLEFDLVSSDPQGGGPLRSRCQLSEDGRHMTFRPQSEPWTGSGALDREGFP